MKPIAAILVLLVCPLALLAGELDFESVRDLEVSFAERYAEIADEAKRLRGKDLALLAFTRAKELDAGNDRVIEFDPDVEDRPNSTGKRLLGRLEKKLADVQRDEARARLALSGRLDDDCDFDEAVKQAAFALTLAPGPVSFAPDGRLSEPGLGELPLSLSLSVLDEFDVYDGRLLPIEELPKSVPWEKRWKLSTPHFLVETDVRAEVCRKVARALEAAREIYRAETGFTVDTLITVQIVSSREHYEELWVGRGEERPKKDNIGRCVREFCAVDGGRPDSEIVTVAMHEVAHGYMNLGMEAATGKRGAAVPVWLSEGFATWCAGFGEDSCSYVDGVVLPGEAKAAPMSMFLHLLEEGKAIPFSEFLWAEDGDSHFYYQAYCFYWFLRDGDEELGKRFRTGVSKLLDAGLGTEEKAVKGNRLMLAELGLTEEELEARFLEWARSTLSKVE